MLTLDGAFKLRCRSTQYAHNFMFDVSCIHRLDASNIFEFPVKWEKNKGVDPDLCPSHSDYLLEMCEKVSSALQKQISDAADLLNMQGSNATHQEVLIHGAHCKKIVQRYMVSSTVKHNAVNLPLSLHFLGSPRDIITNPVLSRWAIQPSTGGPWAHWVRQNCTHGFGRLSPEGEEPTEENGHCCTIPGAHTSFL